MPLSDHIVLGNPTQGRKFPEWSALPEYPMHWHEFAVDLLAAQGPSEDLLFSRLNVLTMGERWVLRPVEIHCYVVEQLHRREELCSGPISWESMG